MDFAKDWAFGSLAEGSEREISCGDIMGSAANRSDCCTSECPARDVGRWCKPLASTAPWQRILPAGFFSESGEIRCNWMTFFSNLMYNNSQKDRTVMNSSIFRLF